MWEKLSLTWKQPERSHYQSHQLALRLKRSITNTMLHLLSSNIKTAFNGMNDKMTVLQTFIFWNTEKKFFASQLVEELESYEGLIKRKWRKTFLKQKLKKLLKLLSPLKVIDKFSLSVESATFAREESEKFYRTLLLLNWCQVTDCAKFSKEQQRRNDRMQIIFKILSELFPLLIRHQGEIAQFKSIRLLH
jgi:hypothetical protein